MTLISKSKRCRARPMASSRVQHPVPTADGRRDPMSLELAAVASSLPLRLREPERVTDPAPVGALPGRAPGSRRSSCSSHPSTLVGTTQSSFNMPLTCGRRSLRRRRRFGYHAADL